MAENSSSKPGDLTVQGVTASERRKTIWTKRIEQLINLEQYTEARELVKEALAEFPNHPGLRGLDSLAEHALRRSAEAGTLAREGRRLLSENHLELAIEVLRQAERLGDRSPEARSALVSALLGRAREVMALDWQEAEPLVHEATHIEPSNPVALSLQAFIRDYRAREQNADPPLQPAGMQTIADGNYPPVGAGQPAERTIAPLIVTKTRKPIIVFGAAGAVGLLVAAIITALFFSRTEPTTQSPKSPGSASVAPSLSGGSMPSSPKTSLTIPTDTAEASDVATSAQVVEVLSFTVGANVPDAVVILNNRELKQHLINGKLTLRRGAGKYRVTVRANDYEPAPEQVVELRTGTTAPPALNFTLSRVAHSAMLVVEGAPADSEILLDGNSIGSYSSGAFRREITPGNHTVTLRKPEYVDVVHYHPFTAGETVTVSGADMKPYGKLVVKISPAAAKVTYKLNGERDTKTLPTNGTISLPPGYYVFESKADGFFPDSQRLTVTAGQESAYNATLRPVVATEKVTPAKVFANGSAWAFSDPESWWTFAQKGFSFTHRNDGTFTFTLPKDTKPFLMDRLRRYEFVADYQDEDNKILYSLDQKHLTRKVFVRGKEQRDQRSETPVQAAGNFYRLVIQITPETVKVEVNGASDSATRPAAHGKFGFVNEVVLIPR